MIRKRPLVFSLLALMAGCSSAPSENVSTSAAAVITTMPFSQIPGATGVDVGSDSMGISWVATSAQNNQEYSWSIGTPLSGTAVPGLTGVAIDVGAQGAWSINASRGIGGWINGVSTGVAGAANDIGVSPDGNTVYVVGVGTRPPPYFYVDFPIYKWVNNAFVPVPGVNGLRIDAANDGSAYVVDHTGAVWHVTGTVASPVSTYFGPSGTNATDVTVGADGTVFVVGNNGAGVNAPIYVYDPAANSWDPLPGALGTRVSASSATVVTVVNSAGTIWTTAPPCGALFEAACPGNACASGLHFDPTLDFCAYCGETGQECCGTACYAAGTTCGGNAALSSDVAQCIASCGAVGERPCTVSSGSGCFGTVLSGSTCVACGADNTVLIGNDCLPRSRTWTFPEVDGTDMGVHPQSLTVNWDGSWSWQGEFWMNSGPVYWSANDTVIIALTTSDGHVYYLQHTGTLSGFGNSSDPANGNWNDFGNGTYSPVSGNWAEIVNASATTKGELNTTAAGILGDLGITAGIAVLIGSAAE